MKINLTFMDPPVCDTSTLVSCTIGIELHGADEDTTGTFNGVPSVQPVHMWAMQLPQNSPLRRN